MSERNYQCLLRLSTWAFLHLLAPELREIIGGEFIPVEGTTVSHLVTTLDQLAGIDAWHVKRGQGVRGMASRIQFIAAGGSAWPTFTVRAWRASGAATELQKRREAIADDHLYPYWMSQAYVQDHRLLGFALARTKDVMETIERGLYYPERTGRKQEGQAAFYVIPWEVMKEAGYPAEVRIHCPERFRRVSQSDDLI